MFIILIDHDPYLINELLLSAFCNHSYIYLDSHERKSKKMPLEEAIQYLDSTEVNEAEDLFTFDDEEVEQGMEEIVEVMQVVDDAIADTCDDHLIGWFKKRSLNFCYIFLCS